MEESTRRIYITELILHISELVTEINLETAHDAFMEHYGHTKQIDVRIYIGGWEKGKEIEYSKYAYYDGEDYEQQLVEIILLLQHVKTL